MILLSPPGSARLSRGLSFAKPPALHVTSGNRKPGGWSLASNPTLVKGGNVFWREGIYFGNSLKGDFALEWSVITLLTERFNLTAAFFP
jgi:hypothetical protein